MGASQPFMYAAYPRDPRFHEKPFDPKAVTRASFQQEPRKPRPTGPLVSFNRHPDTFAVFRSNASDQPTLGPRTTFLIKWLRRLQLGLRIAQLIAAVGVLFLFSVFKNVDDLTTWVVRIMQLIAIANGAYAIFSLSRNITARTAASMSAYQFFAIGLDFASTIAYVLGVIVTRAKSNNWATVFRNQAIMGKLVDAVYYTMIAASGLHFMIIPSAAWLGWTFRSISLLPPDSNPLEDLVESRPSTTHKRNKSSMSAVSHDDESFKRPLTQQTNSRRNSTQQSSQGRTMAFMDTRVKTKSLTDPRVPPLSLPERQYQVQPARFSMDSSSPTKSVYGKSFASSSHKGAYMEVPAAEADSAAVDFDDFFSRDGRRVEEISEARAPYDSDRTRSGLSTTTAVTSGHARNQTRGPKSYAALTQHDNAEDSASDDSDFDEDTQIIRSGRPKSYHPNPLRSNPTSPDQASGRIRQAIRPGSMPAKALEYGNSRANQDDRNPRTRKPGLEEPDHRQRINSIRTEEFFTVPNGQAQDSLAPISVGNVRKASGNDYASRFSAVPYDRQNASDRSDVDRSRDNRYT